MYPSWLLLLCLLALSVGCSRFRHEQHDMVYVCIRETYLHDRVAPVSNRICQVVNGQPLEVLDHNRRFLKVKTGKNEIGWIEQRAVIDSKTYDGFAQLAEQHKADSAAATATLSDDLAMHLLPGRDTDRFYLLAGNTKVELLARGSAPKKTTQALVPLPIPGQAKSTGGSQKTTAGAAKAGEPDSSAPPPPPMEDWWLARDPQGHVGWLLASRLYVDVPNEVAEYAEGQRIIGAWLLTKVNDPESDFPDHLAPEYLTVMSPVKAGLPFDFDQVRVFTWSLKRHRYETAFRLHPIQGYLPVRVSTQSTPKGNVPAFSFQLAANNDVSTDAATGVTRPLSPRTINYEMMDTQVKRIGPDMAPIPITHAPGDKQAAAKARARGSKKAGR